MSTVRLYVAWPIFLALALHGGCTRETPPEIPAYVPPPVVKPVVETPKPEVTETPTPVVVSAPAPAPQPAPSKPVAAPAPKPAEPVAPAPAPPTEQKPPSIIGTWKVVEFSERGRPMPAEVSIQFTFGQDGTLSMSMSMPGGPQGQTQTGTYTVSGDQITITVRNDAKSGTLRFEGNTRATIEVADVKMVLERS